MLLSDVALTNDAWVKSIFSNELFSNGLYSNELYSNELYSNQPFGYRRRLTLLRISMALSILRNLGIRSSEVGSFTNVFELGYKSYAKIKSNIAYPSVCP